jgi:gamma-glutamyltranspeptidase/glutathione hydrolase
MTRRALIWRTVAAFVILPGAIAAQQERPGNTKPPESDEARRWEAGGMRGAVAAGGAEAVAAGLRTLQNGGNAVDAAVATILALSVTDANAFSFGGEVPILIYDARRGTVEVIAGQGAAPRLATRDYFLSRSGKIPLRGIEAAAVPATLDALLTALDRSGTLRFAEAAAPTLAILDRGERPWHAALARTIRELIQAESTATDRRQGLRRAADHFYRGPIARRIDEWSRANGGLIRYTDLATHVTRIEEPVTIAYRGHTIVKCGPWTQGPCLLQALQLLEGFDLKAAAPAGAIHLQAEALKLALADRDAYYADPLFADVPLAGLLAPSYAHARHLLIDPMRASLSIRPGDPRRERPLLAPSAVSGGGDAGHDTTTCLVADAQGNVVAATPSGWSGVLAGPTGVWLGSRLQSFTLDENSPNVIEPGKRPRITLTPTLVLKDGKPVLAVSVAGGDLQDQVSLQMVVGAIDRGLAPAELVRAPRFSTDHHTSSFGQAPPKLGRLTVNTQFGEEVIAELKARGHDVATTPGAIAAPVVLRLEGGALRAAGDPKAGRHAGAY